MSLIDQQTLHTPAKEPKGDTIICTICKRTRCHAKYRRHLLTLVKNGELNMESFHKALFKVRIPRFDMKKKDSQSGYTCHFRDKFNI